jgi:RNA polymerase sigma-70 factor (ECF subfamily)
MASCNQHEPDLALVRQCLSGSNEAWNIFYRRFVRLVRTIVVRQPAIPREDVEDVSQSIFLALVKGLKDYDGTYALSKFVSVVAQRVCIGHYRQLSASKRTHEHHSVPELSADIPEGRVMTCTDASQEDRLTRAELVVILKASLEQIGLRCRRLLELRYFEELPFAKISEMLGVKENTVTVQTKRCLEQLSHAYDRFIQRGVRK